MKDGYEKGEWARGERATRPYNATVDCRAAGTITSTCSEMQVRMGTAAAPEAGGDGSGEAALGDLALPLILPPLHFNRVETHRQSAAPTAPWWAPQFSDPRSASSSRAARAGISLWSLLPACLCWRAAPETKRNILTTRRALYCDLLHLQSLISQPVANAASLLSGYLNISMRWCPWRPV